MFKDAVAGVKHNIPISTNFKVAKYFSISAGGNYQEVWTPYTIKYNDYENGLKHQKIQLENLMPLGHTIMVQVGTTLYGIVNFKKGKKIESIRHTIRPSISYNNQPSFEKYYDTYIIDAREILLNIPDLKMHFLVLLLGDIQVQLELILIIL